MALEGLVTRDDFNRADGALGAAWTPAGVIPGDGSNLVILSNRVRASAGTNNTALYNAAVFSRNCELAVQAQVLPAGSDQFGVFGRMQAPGTADAAGFLASLDATNFYLYGVFGGNYELLLEGGHAWATSDYIALRCVGDHIGVWRIRSGTPTLLGSGAFPGWSNAAGRSGIYQDGTVSRLDNFRAANLPAGATAGSSPRSPAFLRRRR